jgi:hypothetical protein
MATLARSLTEPLQAIVSMRSAPVPRLFFLAYGFLPIGCLSLALQGLVPLHAMALFVLLPATAAALLMGRYDRAWGRLAVAGLLSGIVAVAMYDVVRGSFVLAGAMRDPIPNIGRMALDDPMASPLWGYAWRFVWNGGAMGIAFAMLPFRGVRSGAKFGLFVCGCLFVTLTASQAAQSRFFALNLQNAAIALVGHVVYGSVLGWSLDKLGTRPAHEMWREMVGHQPHVG